MSYYGISEVKLDQAGVEVEEAKVHKFSKNDPNDAEIHLGVGTAMAYHEVAGLISTGDTVFVLEHVGPGEFHHTDKVRVKPGQRGYLESFGKDGVATTSLLDLPRFQ
ncbi:MULTISPECIES: hypothetical protein [Ralstonia solanacearum species complex]|uniref:hypothetical protein n=1 Tax=Ralstonia solanacearum species complex TaxID=3116862 RepID=UPI0004D54403|nr:hypothetical protein [Ralstonia solanacearum]ALF88472.1 hypothetical protein RSUY_21410 [Ralstonia solanacearum]ATI27922.1 hypothetical protein CCY86_10705 [Ralstonia solanacearum]ATJ86678.1 hypothetical protein CDC59_10630 [Ralstonia solanacearum]KEI30752.1 hypothetical protein CQ06_04310 [Ralstonia solanacearum]KFX81526.1 hypothetical protein KR99_22625 [Ralstonia solanacearum]